jgi:hypothetical protein
MNKCPKYNQRNIEYDKRQTGTKLECREQSAIGLMLGSDFLAMHRRVWIIENERRAGEKYQWQ